jgi:hypothetical protein
MHLDASRKLPHQKTDTAYKKEKVQMETHFMQEMI